MTVDQRTDHDCVFVCLAMVLGLTYEQAAARAGAAFMEILQVQGCTGVMEDALYAAFGLKKDVDYVERVYSPHWGTVGGIKNMLWGRRAMVTVRSKNIPDGWYMLYWDGEKVYDPSRKKRYESWDEVEPVEMVLFHHHQRPIGAPPCQ
jgi:hypothetical protein